jgi:hypothetical protein
MYTQILMENSNKGKHLCKTYADWVDNIKTDLNETGCEGIN